MARAFFAFEAGDPDLEWLLNNFLCERPEFFPVENLSLPIVLLPQVDEVWENEEEILTEEELFAETMEEETEEEVV